MTDPLLVLAWLVLAHLVADFLLQTGSIVRAKAAHGSRALVGLVAHGIVVAACLIPVGLAFGGPGWLFVLVTALLHVGIDRTKVVLTRQAAARALEAAHRRHEGPQPADHLGRAWTPWPAALFVLDQLAHLAIVAIGWAVFLALSPLQTAWIDTVDRALGSFDRAVVHGVVSIAVVLGSLAIVNIVAAALFVAILVRPVEQSEGEMRWGSRVAPPSNPQALPAASPGPIRRWTLRVGSIEAARIVAEPERSRGPTDAGPDPAAHSRPPTTARVGATIGVLERILIVVFVLTGSEAAIGFVVAAKTLARFRLLDDRDFAEYYLLGTLASVAVAIVTALIARAALAALL